MRTISSLKITLLCENVVANLRGVGEHGFAAYIETGRENILFDTGSGIGILQNASLFKKNLNKLDKIILSHGHYDHTGGLPQVLDATGPTEVFAHPAAFEKKFAISTIDGEERSNFIGMPHRRFYLEAKGASFSLHRQFHEISEGVFLTGEIPRITSYETGDTRFFAKQGDVFIKDTVPDDQALAFSTKHGLVVILGCAHAGTINTLNYIAEQTKTSHFHAVIGGTHLGLSSREQLEHSIEDLKGFDIEKLGVSHCTGMAAAYRLMKELGEKCFYAPLGTSLEI